MLIDVTWDRDVEKFPPFIVTIKTIAKYIHWDDGTTGIIGVNGKDVFEKYRGITETDIATAKAPHTNYRYIQNASELYKALHTSLNGDTKTQIFPHISNIPSVDDDVSLFFHMTKLTM